MTATTTTSASTPAADAEDVKPLEAFRNLQAPYDWEDVDTLTYQEGGNTFKGVSRKLLFDERARQDNHVRYFEVQPGGWSTFGHHWHTHEVIIYRGSGTVLVGTELRHVKEGDLVYIGPDEWHQLAATDGVTFGFICIIRTEHGKTILPTKEDLEQIYAEHPELKGHIFA